MALLLPPSSFAHLSQRAPSCSCALSRNFPFSTTRCSESCSASCCCNSPVLAPCPSTGARCTRLSASMRRWRGGVGGGCDSTPLLFPAPTPSPRPSVSVRASMAQAEPIPMRSDEVKNIPSVDAIRALTVITALKTPYLPDGRFDLQAFDHLVHLQIDNGAEGIIVGGTTGEGHLMTWDEHIMLIAHAVNCFGDRIKVIGNTGSNSTREAVHATEQGFAVGMHAALHINPYYGKTSHQGLFLHFSSVLPMGPTIIYNVPGRTGQDIPPAVVESLAQAFPNLAGVKECQGQERVELYTKQGITIWSGNDDQCHDAKWRYGAQGVISVMSNLVPGLTRDLLTGSPNPELNAQLAPLVRWLFCEPNPIALNTALSMLGLIRPVFRLPYTPLPQARRREFVEIVRSIGLEHFSGAKDVSVLRDEDFILVGRF